MSKNSKPEAKRKQALTKRLKEQKSRQNYIARIRKQQAKDRDSLLREAMRNASKIGIYKPKSLELTPYRRTRATKALREYGDFLNPKKYFFVEAPVNAREKINKRAESLQMKHTKKGLFIAREGHKEAKFKYDKKRDEYFIERKGKTKRGPTAGVRYRTITPLTSIDELDNERDRMRDMASALGPLRKNEVLVFTVIENGFEGFSKTTFTHVELLIKYLEHYKKTLPAKVNFFRHINVEKATSSKEWFKEHPHTQPGRRGRKDRDKIRETHRLKSL